MLNSEQGKALLQLARHSISSYFLKEELSLPGKFNIKQGVFVTLHDSTARLRGCIGFIDPIFPLEEAVFRAARAAAFSDPRFKPLDKEELQNIVIEISVLTKPESLQLDRGDFKKIVIGEDGLVVEKGNCKGLLLPVVAVEQNWDQRKFIENCCVKAGLDKDSWRDQECRIYRFQAQVFSENDG